MGASPVYNKRLQWQFYSPYKPKFFGPLQNQLHPVLQAQNFHCANVLL